MVPARFRLLLLCGTAAVAVAVAAAACGGDDSGSTKTTTAAPTAATASGGSPTGDGPAAEIDQDNLAFKPSKVTVKAGEKILVKNSESALHTFDVNGKNLSGNMKKGDIFLWTAATAGEFKVSCDYHPQMSATITVK